MLEIKECRSYVNFNKALREAEIEHTEIFKICFDGRGDAEAIFNIKEWLEANFRMYQYKKDNGVKYGEHELFYWSNGEKMYFDVTLNENMSNNADAVNKIIAYLLEAYRETNIYISLDYHSSIDWAAANRYIENLSDIDWDQQNIAVVSSLYAKARCADNTLTIPNREYIVTMESSIMAKLIGKKLEWISSFMGLSTNKTGKIVRLNDGSYGFFKTRCRKSYYPVDFSDIADMQICGG